MSYVYLFQLDDLHKIGWSRNPQQRLGVVRGKAKVAKIVHLIESPSSRQVEMALHRRFAAVRVCGEIFRLSPADVELICAVSRVNVAADLPPTLQAHDGYVSKHWPARPRKEGYRNSVQQIPIEIHEQLKRLAKRNRRSVTAEFVHAMRRHIASPPTVVLISGEPKS